MLVPGKLTQVAIQQRELVERKDVQRTEGETASSQAIRRNTATYYRYKQRTMMNGEGKRGEGETQRVWLCEISVLGDGRFGGRTMGWRM